MKKDNAGEANPETEKKGEMIEASTTIFVLQQRIDMLEKELDKTKNAHKTLTKQNDEQKTRYVFCVSKAYFNRKIW